MIRWLRLRLMEIKLRLKRPEKSVSIRPARDFLADDRDAYAEWLDKTYGREER